MKFIRFHAIFQLTRTQRGNDFNIICSLCNKYVRRSCRHREAHRKSLKHNITAVANVLYPTANQTYTHTHTLWFWIRLFRKNERKERKILSIETKEDDGTCTPDSISLQKQSDVKFQSHTHVQHRAAVIRVNDREKEKEKYREGARKKVYQTISWTIGT